MRRIWELSWPMMIIGVALSFSYTLDPIVIAWKHGADAAAQYGLANRLVQFGTVVVTASAPVLWSSSVRARLQTGRRTDRRGAHGHARLFALISAILGSGLVVIGPFATRVWSGGDVESPRLVFVAFALWMVVLGYQLPLAMQLNDRDGLRFQALTTSVMAAVNVGLSLVLVGVIGSAGPVLASGIALLVCHLVPMAWRLRHLDMQERAARTEPTDRQSSVPAEELPSGT
jgi:O-antigen/teichoic acid export membrane protein